MRVCAEVVQFIHGIHRIVAVLPKAARFPSIPSALALSWSAMMMTMLGFRMAKPTTCNDGTQYRM